MTDTDPQKRDRIFHYVNHHEVLAWLNCGWIVAKPNCAMRLDYYGVTMEWLCDCPMVRPDRAWCGLAA